MGRHVSLFESRRTLLARMLLSGEEERRVTIFGAEQAASYGWAVPALFRNVMRLVSYGL